MDSQDFITAWNGAAECRALAEAQRITQPPQGFPPDLQMIQQGFILLGGVAGGLALDALKDVVKDKLSEYLTEKLSRKAALKVEAVRQPGGGYLLVVTEAGE